MSNIRPDSDRGYDSMLAQEGRTDINNAKRLAACYGDRVRWIPQWKSWVGWDDRRWVADKDVFVIRYAKRVAGDIFHELAEEYQTNSDGARELIIKHAKHTSSGKGVHTMASLAKDEMISSFREFEREPMLLNVHNGTLDLTTGKVRPYDPEDRLLNLCPVVYDQKRRCPRWERFLADVFKGRPDLVDYVRRLVGYCLTGSVAEQMLLFCYGLGGNGKGTFYGTVMDVLGSEYASRAPANFLLWKDFDSHPTEMANLFGRRLVVCSETAEGRHLNETLVKELTGGDVIYARRLYQDSWDFKPSHKIWLISNYKPKITGHDEGIWRRIKVLPFEREFSPTDDPRLEAELRAELPGILAWAVRGCAEWQREGMRTPAGVELETKKYRDESDVVGQFIEQFCDVGEGLKERIGSLYDKFIAEFPDTFGKQQFGERLIRKGFTTLRKEDGREARMPDGQRGWAGIRLKTPKGDELVKSLKAKDQGL